MLWGSCFVFFEPCSTRCFFKQVEGKTCFGGHFLWVSKPDLRWATQDLIGTHLTLSEFVVVCFLSSSLLCVA